VSNNHIIYQIKTASQNDVLLHLKLCNDEFIPKLDTRVNLEAYSIKIHQNAITFEAWNKQQLIGLIATYFNQDQLFGYITNVSITKDYTGKGIASKLLEMCVIYSTTNEYQNIKLEVNKENIPAINFYKKYNFTEIETKADSLIMNVSLTINNKL
jgi:ribosomal protein S18 acetylase RimI-like enzyme